MAREKTLNDFLIKLEEIALNLETEISKYSKEDEIYRYLNDLVEVLSKSKLAFVEGVVELNKKQEKEFREKLKEAGIKDFELEVLLDEVNNLYNLNKNNLLDSKEVLEQKEKSLQVINEVEEKMKAHLNRIDYLQNEKKIKDTRKYLEQIVMLGSKFDESRLEDSIDEIDFFNKTMEELGLSVRERYDMAVMLLEENVKLYKERLFDKEEVKEVEESLEVEEEKKDESDLSKFLFPEEEIEQLEFEEEDDVVDFENDKLSNKELVKLYLGKTPEKLSQEEEKDLIEKAQNGDMDAKNRIIEANLYLVASYANALRNKGLDVGELFQEGSIGLLKAIDKYKDKGYKFANFAHFYVRSEIEKAIAEKAHIVRKPIHVYQEIQKMNETIEKLAEAYGREPTNEEIAKETCKSIDTVEFLKGMDQDLVSLDEQIDDDTMLKDLIVDSKNPEETILNYFAAEEIKELIKNGDLTKIEKEVLRLRFGLDGGRVKLLDEVGEIFGVTGERIRQIEAKALRKLRKQLHINGEWKSKNQHPENDSEYSVVDMLKNAEKERIKEVEYLEDEKSL